MVKKVKHYLTFLLMMSIVQSLNFATLSLCNAHQIDSILIRAYFGYPSNYMTTKRLVKSIANELSNQFEHDSDTLPEIKYDAMTYRRKLPKLEEQIELRREEAIIVISFNKGKTFSLLASSDVNLKTFYSEYLQTGLGKSAKQIFLSEIVEKITKLIKLIANEV